jgi:hypothetical protein
LAGALRPQHSGSGLQLTPQRWLAGSPGRGSFRSRQWLQMG